MTGEPEGRIAEALFEGLTRLEARSLEPAPGVAESWQISPDGKTTPFSCVRRRAGATVGPSPPMTSPTPGVGCKTPP
jgi:hypothetical protein